MSRNFARVKMLPGARVRVRQRGSFGTKNKVRLSALRFARTNIKVKQI